MDKKPLLRDDFVSRVAKKASFTKTDTDILLSAMMETFEDIVRENENVLSTVDKEIKSIPLLKIKNFGRLSMQRIPERVVSKGMRKGDVYPETTRIVFKLSMGIRGADKFSDIDMEDENDI